MNPALIQDADVASGTFVLLLVVMVGINLSFISGMARDITARRRPTDSPAT